MKRYGQRCPVASALDVIGERWTPLIVRELLVGPKRYTDLMDGLPGVGTNVLAGRLADLQAHGVVSKRTLPPPTPVAVYELTDAGRALAPVLRELRTWGSRYGPPPGPDDAVRPAWILQGAVNRSPGLPPDSTCELVIGAEVFTLTGDHDSTHLTAGSTPSPDATLTIELDDFLRLAIGRLDPAHAPVDVVGDRRLANAVLTMIEGSAAPARPEAATGASS